MVHSHIPLFLFSSQLGLEEKKKRNIMATKTRRIRIFNHHGLSKVLAFVFCSIETKKAEDNMNSEYKAIQNTKFIVPQLSIAVHTVCFLLSRKRAEYKIYLVSRPTGCKELSQQYKYNYKY